jgi:hypothetical protein
MKHSSRDQSESNVSAGFPLAVIFLSIIGILAYLAVNGELYDNPHREARVFVPLQSEPAAMTSSKADTR